MNRQSDLRFVSLRRLDHEIAQRLNTGRTLDEGLNHLAGLTQIHYLLITPDGTDVLIAGSADGFAAGPDGRVIGIHTHQPVLCLEDLVVAIGVSARPTTVGCSFDPAPQRLAHSQQLLKQHVTASSPLEAQRGFQQIGQVLGHWNVRVFGVPENSHMAASLVEADFVLKALTTGDFNPGVGGFKSYLSLMKPGADCMQRWWFSPRDDLLQSNSAGTAFQFMGARLQVSAQDELVDDAGNRQAAASTAVGLERYAQQASQKLPALAKIVPAIAHLQNTVDLLVTGALLQQARQDGRLHWSPVCLSNAGQLATKEYGVAKETPSIVRVRMAGPRAVIGLIAGGVTISPYALLQRSTTSDVILPPSSQVVPDDPALWWWDPEP